MPHVYIDGLVQDCSISNVSNGGTTVLYYAIDIICCNNFLSNNVYHSSLDNLIYSFFTEFFSIHNKPALVQIRAGRRTSGKPLSESIIAEVTDAFVRHSASMC